jgi:hypothetical protein
VRSTALPHLSGDAPTIAPASQESSRRCLPRTERSERPALAVGYVIRVTRRPWPRDEEARSRRAGDIVRTAHFGVQKCTSALASCLWLALVCQTAHAEEIRFASRSSDGETAEAKATRVCAGLLLEEIQYSQVAEVFTARPARAADADGHTAEPLLRLPIRSRILLRLDSKEPLLDCRTLLTGATASERSWSFPVT